MIVIKYIIAGIFILGFVVMAVARNKGEGCDEAHDTTDQANDHSKEAIE